MAEQRSAQEVLDDHLVTSPNGNVEDDLARNYAQEVVVVSNWGVKRGHDGVREMARLLRSQLPGCTFAYKARLIEDGRAAGVDHAVAWRVSQRRRGLLRRARRADPGTDDPLHAHPRWLTPGAGRSRRPGPRGARYGPISAARSRISLRWVQRREAATAGLSGAATQGSGYRS
jgi:hypothetical protein